MVDSNHAYSLPTAVRLARSFQLSFHFLSSLEPYDIRWLEEPLVPEDLTGYRDLRSKTRIPIAGGEGSFMRWQNFCFQNQVWFPGSSLGAKGRMCRHCSGEHSRHGTHGHTFQPDISACGGLSEFVKIASLASTFGVSARQNQQLQVPVVPHVWGSAVALATALHAVSTLPLSPFTAK